MHKIKKESDLAEEIFVLYEVAHFSIRFWNKVKPINKFADQIEYVISIST